MERQAQNDEPVKVLGHHFGCNFVRVILLIGGGAGTWWVSLVSPFSA